MCTVYSTEKITKCVLHRQEKLDKYSKFHSSDDFPQNMWFTPVRDRPHLDEEALLRKVNNITEVVVACRDTGLDWFEQLLQSVSYIKFCYCMN